MIKLVRSELIKIRTTNAWWWLGIGAFVITALVLAFNIGTAHYYLNEALPTDVSGEELEYSSSLRDVVGQAANIYTSGQFFGLLFVMLIGILMVTNEFHHQTATTTFLTTPRRTAVIAGKLLGATVVGFGFWLFTTLIDVVAGAIYLEIDGFGPHLGDWQVVRAILLNLVAYAIWTVLGVGFGTLITNQIGAVITAVVLYLIGTQAAQLIFYGLAELFHNDGLREWQVIVPSIASQLMISEIRLPDTPPQWVGAAVLVAYAVVTGMVGVALTRRRDIS